MTRQVARNAIWNLLGTLATLGVGVVAVPVLLHKLGAARLGIFTLALGLIGFSGLLDLGLGRALTQGVSSALGRKGSHGAVAALVWHVLRLLAGFGVFWLVALWLLTPIVVHKLFNLEGALIVETIAGLRCVALSLPFSLVATGAMGALEGLQRFREVSMRRMMLSAVQFGLPTVISLWNPSVAWVTGGLAASRVLGMVVWLGALHRILPGLRGSKHSPQDLRDLLRFGGWLSISNLVSPLMVYADRFYLATLFPPATLMTYTVSYDALFRLTSIPNTAVGAMFPALAEMQAYPAKTAPLLRSATMALIAVIFPPLLLGIIFSKFILAFWLGDSFATSASLIFQILTFGVFINGAAQVPYALLQAHGRSDVTAKLHLAELPLFAGLLIWAVSSYGIIGAAMSWTLRVVLDTVLLHAAVFCLQFEQRRVFMEAIWALVFASMCMLIPMFCTSAITIAVPTIGSCAICLAVLWKLYREWRHSKPLRT